MTSLKVDTLIRESIDFAIPVVLEVDGRWRGSPCIIGDHNESTVKAFFSKKKVQTIKIEDITDIREPDPKECSSLGGMAIMVDKIHY